MKFDMKEIMAKKTVIMGKEFPTVALAGVAAVMLGGTALFVLKKKPKA